MKLSAVFRVFCDTLESTPTFLDDNSRFQYDHRTTALNWVLLNNL